jgi:hypothetical protein
LPSGAQFQSTVSPSSPQPTNRSHDFFPLFCHASHLPPLTCSPHIFSTPCFTPCSIPLGHRQNWSCIHSPAPLPAVAPCRPLRMVCSLLQRPQHRIYYSSFTRRTRRTLDQGSVKSRSR